LSRRVSNIGVYEGDEITGQSRTYKIKAKEKKKHTEKEGKNKERKS